MNVYESVIQGSEPWLAIRRGRATASKFSKILTPTGKLSASAKKYIRGLIGSFLTGEDDEEFFGSKATDRGTALEPLARAAFMERTGLDVKKVGFVTRPELNDTQILGCSPDGLIVASDGLQYTEGLEIKCPGAAKFVEIVDEGVIPDEYKVQCHGCLAVTGMDRWHLWVWHPHPDIAPFYRVVERDDFTELLSRTLDDFVIQYAAMRAALIPKLKAA